MSDPGAQPASKPPSEDWCSGDLGRRLERLEHLEAEVLELRRALLPPRSEIPSQPVSCLEVRVGEGQYLLPVEAVREVLPLVWPRPLPETPPWVRGTFRLEAAIVPLVDLLYRFTRVPSPLHPQFRIVLVETPRPLGLLVDEVGEVSTVLPGDLAPPPSGLSQAPFLSATHAGEGGTTRYLVALDRLGVRIPEDDDSAA